MPLGLCSLIAVLKNDGHEVSVFDFSFFDHSLSQFEDAIGDPALDVIGFSLRNIDNVSKTYSREFISRSCELVKQSKELSKSYIVLGGCGFSLFCSEIMEKTKADFGIFGEGEWAFSQLLKALCGAHHFEQIPNLLFFENKILKKNPLMAIQNLDLLPMPDRTLFKKGYEKWLSTNERQSVYNIQTKRGCAFSCIYCSYPSIEGKRVRLRSFQNVVNELQNLVEQDRVKQIDFVDSVFNFPINHAQAICSEIIRRNLSIKWTCFLSPSLVTEQLLDLMIKAGCVHAELGLDSCSVSMLKNLNKNFSVEEIEKTIRLFDQKKFSYSCSLIFGGPGETLATVQETVCKLEQFKVQNVFGLIGLRIYPNTPLEEIACREHIISHQESLLMPKFYFSHMLNESELRGFFSEVLQNHPHWNIF